MKLIALAILTTVCLGALASPGQPKWNTFRSEDGRFTVTMPGRPDGSRKMVKGDAASVKLHVFMASTESESFVVTYADYERFDGNRANVDRILDAARDGAVANARGSLISEKKIMIGGRPGRSILFTTGTGKHIQEKILLVNNRLYQIYVVSNAGGAESADAKRFMKSFRVIRK
ncbi:MAG: hypothetical protein ACR2HJ_09730 [Fimbriimonadales bacterium]